METLWTFIRIFTVLGVVSGIAIWVLPKKWIMGSGIAAEVLSDGGPATWKGANRIGKTIYLIFYASIGLLAGLLMMGYFLELYG